MALTDSRGFSLLELLVVVVIIGILASMFTLSVGLTGGDRELEREADRLQALLQLASEDAVIQGRELGLRFFPDGYEFSPLDPGDNEWQVMGNDPLLRERSLSPDLELLLIIEGREVDLQDSRDEWEEQRARQDDDEDDSGDRDADNSYRPQVYVFSSGDFEPPFSLELSRRFGDLTLSLDVSADGAVEITRDVL